MRLLAWRLDHRDSAQATHGALTIAAGAVLLLAGVPVWWTAWRARAARRTRTAERAAAMATAARAAPAPGPAWWTVQGAVSYVLADTLALAARVSRRARR